MAFYPFNELDGTDAERGLGYNLNTMRFVDMLEMFNWTGDRHYIECKIPKETLEYWKEEYNNRRQYARNT